VAEISEAEQLAYIVLRRLAHGKAVKIDGLGVFFPDRQRGVRFEPQSPRIFLAYVREDQKPAERLYDDLEGAGFSPWMDVRKLVAGQNWPRALEGAIETSDFFIACFSRNSVNRWGGFQAEIRYALDCARRIPLDEAFVVPLRLEECRVPRSIQRELHWVDLFPDWEKGVDRLKATLRRRAG
jgi:hypothetical protein